MIETVAPLNALFRKRVIEKQKGGSRTSGLAENAGLAGPTSNSTESENGIYLPVANGSNRSLNVPAMQPQPQTEQSTAPTGTSGQPDFLEDFRVFLGILHVTQQIEINDLMSYEQRIIRASGDAGASAQGDNVKRWKQFISTLNIKQVSQLRRTEAWKQKPLKERIAIEDYGNFSDADDAFRHKPSNCSADCYYWSKMAENSIITIDNANKLFELKNIELLSMHEKCQACRKAVRENHQLKTKVDGLKVKIEKMRTSHHEELGKERNDKLDLKSKFEEKDKKCTSLEKEAKEFQLAFKNHKTDTNKNKVGFQDNIMALEITVSDLHAKNQALLNRIAELEQQKTVVNTAAESEVSMPHSLLSETTLQAELENQAGINNLQDPLSEEIPAGQDSKEAADPDALSYF